MGLVPVIPVVYVHDALWVVRESGFVGFCVALLIVAAALSVGGVIAVFVSRLDG